MTNISDEVRLISDESIGLVIKCKCIIINMNWFLAEYGTNVSLQGKEQDNKMFDKLV